MQELHPSIQAANQTAMAHADKETIVHEQFNQILGTRCPPQCTIVSNNTSIIIMATNSPFIITIMLLSSMCE